FNTDIRLVTKLTEGDVNVYQIADLTIPDGGTSITTALQRAQREFAKEEFDTAELMLVTDGEDEFSVDTLKQILSSAEIRLTTVAVDTQRTDLQMLSSRYYQVRT